MFAWFEFNQLKAHYIEPGFSNVIRRMGMTDRVLTNGYLACFCEKEKEENPDFDPTWGYSIITEPEPVKLCFKWT
jgi:hypothetical protein